MQLPLLCKISGATYTPSASGSYGKLAGLQLDKVLVDLKFDFLRV